MPRRYNIHFAVATVPFFLSGRARAGCPKCSKPHTSLFPPGSTVETGPMIANQHLDTRNLPHVGRASSRGLAASLSFSLSLSLSLSLSHLLACTAFGRSLSHSLTLSLSLYRHWGSGRSGPIPPHASAQPRFVARIEFSWWGGTPPPGSA